MAVYSRWSILYPKKPKPKPQRMTPAEAGAVRHQLQDRNCLRCGVPIPQAQVYRLYCTQNCAVKAAHERKKLDQVVAIGQIPCPLCEAMMPVLIGYPKQPQPVTCPGCGVKHKVRLAEDVEGILAAIRAPTGLKAYPRVQLPESTNV